jgi:ubiquinone/menaquinone biosynthesis C-methylase UbiE
MMTQQYDRAVAAHYSAYRPPLHQMILQKALSGSGPFDDGLDVGCGTGYSAVGLASHCQRVYGIEPSQSMLDRAIPHPRVLYRKGTGEALPLPDHSVDVVTFAGSLFYAKSDALSDEMKRVCRDKALVIAYDFELLLKDVVRQCGIDATETESPYDYTVNFSESALFREVAVGREQVSLDLTAAELAHILLSESQYHGAFVEKYGLSDPFAALTSELAAVRNTHSLAAHIYFSTYETP